MTDQTDELELARKVKQQLEAALGREIDVSPEQLIRLWYPAGAYDFSDGNICFHSILLPGKRCNQATLLDVHGTSSTGENGQRNFLASDFFCLDRFVLADPVNVVASPRTSAPVFVTVTHSLVNRAVNNFNCTDVQIMAYSWDANGRPAPNVPFYWRCRAVSMPILL